MSIVTSRWRVRIAPYQHAHPDRPISMVIADHTDIVTIHFHDGSTARAPKAEELD